MKQLTEQDCSYVLQCCAIFREPVKVEYVPKFYDDQPGILLNGWLTITSSPYQDRCTYFLYEDDNEQASHATGTLRDATILAVQMLSYNLCKQVQDQLATEAQAAEYLKTQELP